MMLKILLLAVYALRSSQPAEILLLHTNDLRGTLEGIYSESQEKKVGGYSRISHVIDEARNEAKNRSGPAVLYLDSGDVYSDPMWSDPFARKILIELSNYLNPDAASLGCHNFLNPDIMKEFLGRIRFPIVVSNLKFRSNHKSGYCGKILRHLVLNVDGIPLGLVGYVTPKMHVLDGIRDDEIIGIEDEVVGVSREVKNLKKINATFIIALGHSGYQTDRVIAEKIEGIDVILGGFSHGLYWNDARSPSDENIKGPYPVVVQNRRTRKDVLIFHTYGFSKYLGRVLLKFDDRSNLQDYVADPIFLSHDSPENPEVTGLIKIYKRALSSVEDPDEVLARCVVPLDTTRVRVQESNLANIVTDSFVYRAIAMYQDQLKYSLGFYTDTAVSIINAGALRQSFATSRTKPNITVAMIKQLLPYRQHIVRVTMRGSSIIESLETGVSSNGETNRGEYLQFSGLRVVYDSQSKSGHRVRLVRIRCAECAQPTFSRIQTHSTYNIVLSAFLAKGGDGHVTIKSEGFNRTVFPEYDVDIFRDYLKKIGQVRPEVDERIQEVTNQQRRRMFLQFNVAVTLHNDLYRYTFVFLPILIGLK